MVRARGQPAHDVVVLGRRRQHDDPHRGEARVAPELGADLQTAHVRQVHVEEDQVGSVRLGEGERRLAVEGFDDQDPLVLERHPHELDDVGLVVGDQDRWHRARSAASAMPDGRGWGEAKLARARELDCSAEGAECPVR